jgi:hypothetical protein
MDTAHEDCFVVYVRPDPSHFQRPEAVEPTAIHCPTYEDARKVRQVYQGPNCTCVIRFIGPVGGGD